MNSNAGRLIAATRALHELQEPRQLVTPFGSPTMVFAFSKAEYRIEWGQVRLDDGSLLIMPQNAKLFELLQTFVCAQLHYSQIGHSPHVAQYYKYTLLRAVLIIDYFILNAERLSLAKHGLRSFTQADMYELLTCVASHSSSSVSIYQWPEALASFFRREIQKPLEAVGPKRRRVTVPDIEFDVLDVQQSDRLMQLSDEELRAARRYLDYHDLYKLGRPENGYRLIPNMTKLAGLIFPHTIGLGGNKPPVFDELCIAPYDEYTREYEAISVRLGYEDDRCSRKTYGFFVATLSSLALLNEIGARISPSVFDALRNNQFVKSLDFFKGGRTRTAPVAYVISAMREAIAFFFEHGAHLVESYLAVAEAASLAGLSLRQFGRCTDIRPYLAPKTSEMGVKVWSVKEPPTWYQATGNQPSIHERIRANDGLHQLLQVLVGAMQTVIGALMARRVGELVDLDATTCLDVTREWLLFENRKSGPATHRTTEARPIPHIAQKMVSLLQHMHSGLTRLGFSTPKSKLFALPTSINRPAASLNCYFARTDTFLDYIDAPTIEGRRLYLRQHQLRRFFAMVFFYAFGLGEIETLRWFLGHSDVEMVYRYICEIIPGRAMRQVKAQYAAWVVNERIPEYDDLRELVKHHFGTSNFNVLTIHEVEAYLEDLQVNGDVIIEPQFFHTDNGTKCRILIKISENLMPEAQND